MNEHTHAPDQDVVISSRVRLSRNFDDLPFSPKMTTQYADMVIERVSEAVFDSPRGDSFLLMRLGDMEQDARTRLVEHHLISYDLLKFVSRSAVMLSEDTSLSIMCNEEEHVRLQGLLPGLQPEHAADLALRMDDEIGKRHPFAFDSQWGYLTSLPASVGTGMRCSVILHLPALASSAKMGAVMQAVAKLGLTIRGLYGDGTESRGHLYQLSNQATLGRSEEDVIRSIKAAATQIVGHERAMRESIEKKDMLQLQDSLMRSWGELMYASLMSTKEFMTRYSDIRYAVSMGYLHASLPQLDLLMMDLQPGSLGVRAGKLIGSRESEILRARILREELKKIVKD